MKTRPIRYYCLWNWMSTWRVCVFLLSCQSGLEIKRKPRLLGWKKILSAAFSVLPLKWKCFLFPTDLLLLLHSHFFTAGSQLLPLHGCVSVFPLGQLWAAFSCCQSATSKLIDSSRARPPGNYSLLAFFYRWMLLRCKVGQINNK